MQINRIKGFTLIEVMVIAPIVILFIGAFIGLIVNLTGDGLKMRSTNDMAYQVQDALDEIEADVGRSIGGYPITTGTLTSPQGNNNGTAAFTVTNNDTSASDNDVLIVNTPATTQAPVNPDRELIRYNSPNACGSSSVSENPYYPVTSVYFVASGTLWKRTILPASGTPCSTPWQRASCAESQSLTGVCKAYDEKLASDVESFSVQYLKADGTAHAAASADTAKSVKVTLKANKLVAGKAITYTGTVRTTASNSSSVEGGGGSGGGGGVGSNTVTFNFTDGQQTWQVPAGINLVQLEVWGAEGSSYATGAGGKGGYAKGQLSVTPGQTLYVYVGGKPANYSALQGYNGGGHGSGDNGNGTGGTGGGGATDIRTSTSLSTRVIVGGGGGGGYYGGSGADALGGNGGGASGSPGGGYSGSGAAGGGTQSAGGAGGGYGGQAGSLGIAGYAGSYGGGGGGGYYGGGGGMGGGGGSSYIGGVTSGTTTAGLRSGNGQVIITY